jgi:Carboxypeptidase regulatory-like domain/TonB-dependent Receptor Plug Domain
MLRWRHVSWLTVAVLLAGVLAGGPAFGQTTGDIQGTVTDQQGATLPGVTIEARSPNLQGTRTAVTGADGKFRFPAVPPGAYKIRASLSGFTTAEKTAVVSLDATATVNMSLQVSAKEEVVVTGEAPLVDTTSTTTGTTYTEQVIAKLPAQRNYAGILQLNPGVSTDRGETQGRALALTVYGATSVENQFVIDGVNTTNVIKGFQGKAINNEFIQEVEVKTGGYQAEYGRALGGVINVITKSGGNEYHGDGFVYFDSINTRAKQTITGHDSLTGMKTSDYKRTDYGADIGGFFVKDHVWFFLAYDRVDRPGKISRYSSSASVPVSAQFPLDETDNLLSAKLTWNIATGSTFVATGFEDPTVISGAANSDPNQSRAVTISSLDPRTWNARRDIGGTDFGLRFNQLFGSMGLVSLQWSRHQDRFELKPSGAGAGVRVDDFTCAGGTPALPCVPPATANSTTGGFGQVFGPTARNASTRYQYRGDATFYFGNHEVKFGGDLDRAKTRAVTFYTGGQNVQVKNELGTTYYEHIFFAASAADLTPTVNVVAPRSIDKGAFIQDSWKATAGLTVNVGLRWDEEDIRDYADRSVIKTTAEWQPRIGVVWDPKRDGSMKIYAFGGRFYYSIPTDLNVRAYGAQTEANTFNFDPISVTQDPTVPGHPTAFIQGGAFTEPVDKGIKGIYQDEFTVGVDKLIDPTFSVGIAGHYRRLGRAIEDRCDLDYTAPENNANTCGIVNPGSGGQWSSGNFTYCTGLDNNTCGLYPAPAAPPARRLYRGIEILARKSFTDKLWLQASYVYSSLRGNYDGEVREGRGQTDPGINADFDYYEFFHNSYGRLFLDRPHNLRVDLSYTTPWKLFVGFQGFIQSGAPLNKQGYFNSGYGAEVQLVQKGYAGRLPTTWESNLSLGYPITFGPVTVTAQLYAFNIFNNQIRTLTDVRYSTSPPAGYPDTLYDPNQQQTNPNYGRVTQRQDPRLFRGALKISF